MSERHLLVVDDDDRIRELLREFLGREGFRVSVAADGAAARRLLDALHFDLIVMDVMMPEEDGFALTAWLRGLKGEAGACPVLMLTARDGPNDRIEGLRLGADDYLPKPFEPQELLLRIEAILRRVASAPPAGPRISLGGRTFDATRGELVGAAEAIRLTDAETRLLSALAARANLAVDRDELAGDASDGAGRAVDIQVTRLRRKIEDDPANPRYLRTVRGRGYMLTPD